MSSLTPNLGLYMPDANDDYEDFRSEFNGNMLILDGAGGGGHVIVDENGNDMPQESKLQFTGGVNVTDDNGNGATIVNILGGGGGNVFGAFINTNRIITSGTYSTSYIYTATEDCCFQFNVGGTSLSSGKVYIDGDLIQSVYITSNNDYRDFVFLRKGQIITLDSPQSGTFNYTVYGIVQGTESIFTPIIYSDNERMIGIWRNNKPLYQRSFPFTINVSGGQTATIDTISDYDEIVYLNGWINESSIFYSIPDPSLRVKVGSSGQLQLYCSTGSSWNGSGYITLRYTKASDVAGSGDWNTDGIPTIHYSTNEQVIGTWINGKPLYQITLEYNGTISPNVTNNYANVASLNIETFVSGTGTGYESGWGWEQLPANLTRIHYNDTSGYIELVAGAISIVGTCYVTITYTKTTD